MGPSGPVTGLLYLYLYIRRCLHVLIYHDVLVTSIRNLHFNVDFIKNSDFLNSTKYKNFEALFPNISTLPCTSVASS
jgi:hypothetical protein